MKTYNLASTTFLGMLMKKIYYNIPISRTNTPTSFINIIIHHTGKSNTIQKILDLHVEKNHWAAIGYHFMIGKNGQIYYSRDLNYAGAHTYHFNKNSIGIALFGNLDEEKPTFKQVETLQNLIKGLKTYYHIRRILGHNEAIYAYLKNKYWKANLPETDILNFKTKEEYTLFVKTITTKILKTDSSSDAQNSVKRFKTCPGFELYATVKEIGETL